MKRISIVILLISFVFVTLNAVYHKVGEISTSNSYAAIAIHEQLAFIGDDSLGLGIYNIDDPTTPVFLSNVELFSQIYRIELLGEYAFVMCADSTLQIVDVGDPYNPEIVSEYNLIQRGFRFCLNSNYAYIVEANENVEVVNIENPENPQYVNEFFLTNSGMSCDVSNTLAFIGTGFGLYVYDISNPDEMVEIGWFDTGNTHVVKIQGNLLYFAGVNGLGIIDFSDQNNLNLLSTNDELNFNDCVISDNILYGANEYVAIAVDISDSLSPTLIGSYVIIECSFRIDIANDHIFID